jgi:HSP20 family protein
MVFGYRNPRYPFDQLRDEMDRLWTGVFGPADGLRAAGPRNQPAANVWEREDALLVEMEVPGVKSDQVDLSVVGDELSIKVTRPETAENVIAYHRRERPTGSFTRVLRLPVEVDAGRVEAELHDGVLTITLAKAETAKPRKIEVTSM